MRTTYKILAHLIAVAVVVQTALIAMTMFMVIQIAGEGNSLGGPPVTAILHGNIGEMAIPALAVALVVVSIFAHAGMKWALWLILAVAVQYVLAIIAFGAPWVGLLHAANAFTILALAELGAYAVAHAPAYVPQVKASMRPAL